MSEQATFTPTGLDGLVPRDVARKAESIGMAKAAMPGAIGAVYWVVYLPPGEERA